MVAHNPEAQNSFDELPHWRFAIAMELFREANGRPPHHDDPWIRHTAEFLLAGVDDSFRLEGRVYRHIRDALRRHWKNLLANQLLQSLLTEPERIDQIPLRYNIDPTTLRAYEAVTCDLSDHRRCQAWMRSLMVPTPDVHRSVRGISRLLQSQLMWAGCAPLEQTAAELCRLTGPTMADGVSERDAPRFFVEYGTRFSIAMALLPYSKPNHRLTQQFERSLGRNPFGVPTSQKSADIAMQILHKVRIPKVLQKELDGLREFCQPFHRPTTQPDADPNQRIPV